MAKQVAFSNVFPEEEDEYKIQKDVGSINIGRSPLHCSITVNEPYVSAVHCSLTVYEQEQKKSKTGHVRVAVTDSSTNGTWIINKQDKEKKPLQKGKQTTLADGDIIMLPEGISFKFLALPSPRLVKYHLPDEHDIKRGNRGNYNTSLSSTSKNFHSETKSSFSACQSSKCDLKRKAELVNCCSIIGAEPVAELQRSQPSLETSECCYCGQMILILTHGLHEMACEGNSQASNREELKISGTLSQCNSDRSDKDEVSFPSDGIGNKITVHCDDDRSTDEDVIQSQDVFVSKNMAGQCEHQVSMSYAAGSDDGTVDALETCMGEPPSHALYDGHSIPDSLVLLEKEESVERCTFCSKNFPISELVSHAQICSDANTKCIVESEPSPDSDEYELCPHCSEDFPLTQLVPHVQLCTKNPESTHSSRENSFRENLQSSFGEDRESSLELCPHCGEEFPIAVLVDHAQTCTKNPKRKKLEDMNENSLRENPEISSSSFYDEVHPSTTDNDSQSLQQELKRICPYCLQEFSICFATDHIASCKGKTSEDENERCCTKLKTAGFVKSDDVARRDSRQGVLTDCPLCGIELPVSLISKHFIICDSKYSGSLDNLEYSSGDMRQKTSPAEECVENLRSRVTVVKASSNLAKFDSHSDSSVKPGESEEPKKTGSRSGSDEFEGEETEVNLTLSTGNSLTAVVEEGEDSGETALLLRKESSLNSYQDCQEQCCYCLEMFPICKLVQHASSCMEQSRTEDQDVEQCCHCLDLFPLSDLVFHALKCNRRSVDKCGEEGNVSCQSSDASEPVERCMYCFRDFPVCTLIAHAQTCDGDISGPRERFKGFLPSAHDLSALSSLAVLSRVQQNALDYVIKCSARDSRRATVELVTRVQTLGYRKEDLQKTLHWVRGAAPIIIHVNLDTCLHFLVSDTHYRNRFETGTSGGSLDKLARMSWESNIFNGIYDSSRPEDRVKYGVLSIVGDPHGVRSCLTYGDSFLQLKKVRLRATFASMDTSGVGVKLSCCEHYGNVLYEYTDGELKAIMDVATGRVSFRRSDCISQYKEVQIHGPVSLSENIECVVVNSRHHWDRRINRLLDQFVEQTKCNLIWMDLDELSSSGSYY